MKGRGMDHKEPQFHCQDKPIPSVDGSVSWFQLRLSQVILDAWRGAVKERLLFPFLLKKLTRKKLNMTDGNKEEKRDTLCTWKDCQKTYHLSVWLSENIPSFCGLEYYFLINSRSQKCKTGLPWLLSGKEFACQCRTHGLDPWSGRIPRASEQRSPCATTIEACTPQ